MKRCKITAVRKTEYKDLMEKYENPIQHACDIEEGQVFITEGWKRPEGFCESAWESISPFVMTLAYGGSDIYEVCMKNKNSAMISCNDGFRPVSFYIEVLDEKIYQRGDKKFNINSQIVDCKSYDEIPPRVEYSLTQKGKSVVPILQSICQWSDIFYKEEGQNEMVQCQKCDHRG